MNKRWPTFEGNFHVDFGGNREKLNVKNTAYIQIVQTSKFYSSGLLSSTSVQVNPTNRHQSLKSLSFVSPMKALDHSSHEDIQHNKSKSRKVNALTPSDEQT